MKAVDAHCHYSQCVQDMACTHASIYHVQDVLVTLLVLKMLCARVIAARNTGSRTPCGLCACITQGPLQAALIYSDCAHTLVYLNPCSRFFQAAEYSAEQTGIAGRRDLQCQRHCSVAYMHASLHMFCMLAVLPWSSPHCRHCLRTSRKQGDQAAACCAEQTGIAHICHVL